jgi:hypothetical protein
MRSVVLEQLTAEHGANDLDVLARLLERLAPRLTVLDGVRPGICMIAEPSLILSVVAPSHERTVTQSVPHASAAHAES